MEKYVLFVNSETDYLLLPVKNFVGAKYSSATVIDLYFEKAPLSYKIPLTVNTNTGDEVAKGIAELFYNHSKPIILHQLLIVSIAQVLFLEMCSINKEL
mgnify:CR=1 FL=1